MSTGCARNIPLPETADELCAVAHRIGAPTDAVDLGEWASEKTIKALSADGTLAQSPVVAFATHGLIAGETQMFLASARRAGADSDPARESERGRRRPVDGLRGRALKLDADWVVLSACNTAAGIVGAEALSGLARAFFMGGRSLLVSHWAVDSEAP